MPRPLIERFYEKFLGEPNSGCWLWDGSLTGQHYGAIQNDRHRSLSAHRVSWEIHRGKIPTGLCVLHKCDIPTCVNPDHLFLGTQSQNIADRNAKGRQSKGETHNKAKLTSEEVTQIREMRGSHRSIAERFSMSHTAIGAIKRGQTWK